MLTLLYWLTMCCSGWLDWWLWWASLGSWLGCAWVFSNCPNRKQTRTCQLTTTTTSRVILLISPTSSNNPSRSTGSPRSTSATWPSSSTASCSSAANWPQCTCLTNCTQRTQPTSLLWPSPPPSTSSTRSSTLFLCISAIPSAMLCLTIKIYWMLRLC